MCLNPWHKGEISPAIRQLQRETPWEVKSLLPCGRCLECLRRRQKEWIFRINCETEESVNPLFITCTYKDEDLPLGEEDAPTLHYKDFQDFLKRLRIAQKRYIENGQIPFPNEFKKSTKRVFDTEKLRKIRFFCSAEYGDQYGRPHFHAALWNLHPDMESQLDSLWRHGHVHIRQLKPERINYLTKYMLKKEDDEQKERQVPQFTRMSTNPGIGANYLRMVQFQRNTNEPGIVRINGYPQGLPRYYRDRMFDWEERLQLAEDSKSRAREAQKEVYEKLLRMGVSEPEKEWRRRRFAQLVNTKHKGKRFTKL